MNLTYDTQLLVAEPCFTCQGSGEHKTFDKDDGDGLQITGCPRCKGKGHIEQVVTLRELAVFFNSIK